MKKADERKPLVEWLFYGYGRFVATHALVFILVPLVLTAALSVGFYHIEVDRELARLFYPQQQNGFYERQTALNYSLLSETGHYRVRNCFI